MKHRTSESASPIRFAGLSFRGYSQEAIRSATDKPKFIVTVNADFIVRAHEDVHFKSIIDRNLSTFDGQIPFWLARLRNTKRAREIEKLSGSDLIYSLLKEASDTNKVSFLLGASPNANARAIEVGSKLYGGQVLGYSPPLANEPIPSYWTNEVLHRIQASRPSFLFVALGAPKQERWIADHLQELSDSGVELVIGCGGSIDFLAGTIRRAPRWIQSLGMEGVYRLVMEPRLFRLIRLLRSFRVFAYVFR